MATVNVKNVNELMAALNNATGDTTIRLAPGNYNNLYLSGNKIPELSNNADITITSQNANNPASITSMILIGAKNVTFDGITFDYTASSGASVGTRPFMFLTTDNVTVQNSTFDGDLARGLSNTENGYGTGIAMGIKGSTNLTVTNNTFYNFHKGTVAENSTNVVITHNDISKMASDGIGFQASKNVMIANNYIHDFASHPNTNAHKDMIQFWSAGKNTASSNVTIKDNVLDSGGGTYTQSILVGTSNGTTYSDFVIEDNLIHNSFTHGITLDNIKNVVVQNNTVLHNADTAVNSSGLYVPKIHIGNQVSSATVKDNITHAVTGSKWNGSGNLIVQNTDPNQPNYYGDLFVDALAGKNATVADLAGVPGGVIEKSGVGANISQLPNTNATSSTPTTNNTNNTTNTQTASNTNNNTDTDTNNTPTPTNTATKTGTAIDVDFQKGITDQSTKANVASSKGVTIVTDQGSKVAKLSSNSVITYKDTPDLFNNKAYTVMADFRKDHMSDSGKLITFANSFVVQVKDDRLSVSVTTDKGTKWINIKAPVDDTSWHKVALTFDSSSGKALLYLDGAQVGSVSGLRGAVQTGNTSQDFHVGSPWGGSFDGRVDNVTFLTNDLTASEIKSIHAGTASVPTSTNTPTTNNNNNTDNNTDTGSNTAPTPTKAGTAIDVDFQKGITDQSTKANVASSKGVTIVTDQGSKVAKMGTKSVITYKDTPDLFNNKAYTVMADFRKDNMSDKGKLITFADSFVVQVKGDMLSVSVTTTKGTKWINTKAPVDDTSWHKVALTFDSSSGKAVLYLDGAQVGSVSGLRGAVQTGNQSQDFHIGSPWGGSFNGRVDNVAFLTNDLTASEIKSIHAGSASVPTSTSSGSSSNTSPGISGLSSTAATTSAADSTGTDINTGGSFSYTMTANKTKVVLDKAAQAGIIDQAYLSGDTARAFNVKIIDTQSSTRFDNSLGVYEVDAKGKIVDVRMLDTDAQTGEGTIRVTGVEKGHDLGFFIVQDGYNRLDKVLGGNNLSLEVKSGDVYLKSGSKVITNKVFVSHDKNLNYDNHEHVASMDNPNTSGAIIAFEDQQYGGNRNDLSDVVFEVTAVGADELSFA